jgi:hypothetical protein
MRGSKWGCGGGAGYLPDRLITTPVQTAVVIVLEDAGATFYQIIARYADRYLQVVETLVSEHIL